MKTKAIILTIFLVFASLCAGGTLYPAINDNSDRLSDEQSGIFSPGYINASKQKTDAIIGQLDPRKSFIDKLMESVQSKVLDKVTDDASKMVKPELKRKKGTASEGASRLIAEASGTNFIDSTQYNVDIGTGTDKVYQNDRLISEVIDGQRYIYSGFDNVGKTTIQSAINMAKAGDKIIVKAGSYNYAYDEGNGGLQLKDGVSLYGGYSENGVRDIVNTSTVINGTIVYSGIKEAEINGFTIYTSDGYQCMIIRESSNLTIAYNTFEDGELTISANSSQSFITIKNNNFYNANVWMNGNYRDDEEAHFEYIPFITSANNNFYGNYAFETDSLANVSSSNDYFMGQQSLPYIINPKSTPNTWTYTAVSNNLVASQSSNNLSYQANMHEDGFFESTLFNVESGKAIDGYTLSSIFKGLLANKDAIMMSGPVSDSALIAKLMANVSGESTLAVPVVNADTMSAQMEAALALANIMKNPTEDQKMMLDAVTALLSMVDSINAQNENPDLKKAEDNLLQAVASIMLAQAIPDLLKEGDVANIKNIFADLGANKGKIMLEYQESTKPYYDNIVKSLSKNMQLLQLKNILSKNMTQEELERLSRSDLDKIMEKLKRESNKSFEEEYMLQQEAKYRRQYMDPNKKMLEDKMKDMMRGFAQRLSKVLEGVQKTEKK